jgi:hypothetical protein
MEISEERKALYQYARLRKLPEVINLGNIDNSKRISLLEDVDKTPISNDRAVKNRKGVYGVEHDYSTPAGKTYNQRHIDKLIKLTSFAECLENFVDIFDWRYAELEKDSSIPEHLDNPYYYRLIVMLKGQHEYVTYKKEKIIMSENEVWFVNPAYHHSVKNITDGKRIALLGKIEINENNTKLLRDRTRK